MPTGFKILGLSSRLVFIVWAVFGGFLYHILLSNYLTILIKPAYNAPVDTAQDVWDRGLTINIIPVGAIWKQFLELSTIPIYNKLAERVVLAKEGFILQTSYFHVSLFEQDDADFLHQTRYGVHGNGTHVQMQGLGSWQTLDTSMGRWYRSKETIAGKNPYFGYLANKRWPLNEAITMHLMYFAQV